MEMKNKVIDYIQACGISVTYLSEALQMEEEKFSKNTEEDWEARELLDVCAFLNIDPMSFHTKKLSR